MISITDVNDSRLELFTSTPENILAHYYEPEPGLFLAESMKVLERALAAGYEPVSALIEDRCLKAVEELLGDRPDMTVYVAEYDVLKQLTGYNMTGGVLCVMKRKMLPSVESICKGARRIAVLDDVTNPTNVGSIFRNAAALGIDAVLLTTDSCDPLYKRAVRVSMGTVFQVPWTVIGDRKALPDGKRVIWPEQGFEMLKEMGFATVAMALDDRAIGINDKKLRAENKLAILLGSEGYGLKKETIEACDYTVMIPMSNDVDSLNVAAASALAFWELTKNSENAD
ncbi:MAG: RNA methyltransferase [Lachnospiraceae bacterium]|nr:RNA methyltransferase [Lachnospiraceae bacterium]